MRSVDIDDFTTGLLRPHAVKPKILRDAKHPTIEPGSRLPLIEAGQCTRAGFLHQVIATINLSRQRIRKSAQARQKFHDPVSEISRHVFTSRPVN
jgi:ribosomal protein S14